MSITFNMLATRFGRTLTRGAAAGAIGLIALLPGVAFADPAPALPNVPASIAVTDGSVPYLFWHAIGTQNYVCQFSDGAYTWRFTGPSATLYDDLDYDEQDKQVGSHFAGPTWQARDGSRVAGAVEASAPVPDAIPWLRLKVTSTAPGPDDGDRLLPTTYIQRVNTTGGISPSTGCDAGSVGEVARVPYTADYYFYRPSD